MNNTVDWVYIKTLIEDCEEESHDFNEGLSNLWVFHSLYRHLCSHFQLVFIKGNGEVACGEIFRVFIIVCIILGSVQRENSISSFFTRRGKQLFQ